MKSERPMSLAPQLEYHPEINSGVDIACDEREPLYLEAGLFSYFVAMAGLAAFPMFAIGPAWAGFLAAGIPTFLLSAWAVSRG